MLAKKLFPVLLVLSALVVGCQSVGMLSFANPSYTGRRFNKVLVAAKFDTYDAIVEFETAMASTLRDRDHSAIAQSSVLPPLRDYSDSEVLAYCKQNGYDSYLAIAPRGRITVSNWSGAFSAFQLFGTPAAVGYHGLQQPQVPSTMYGSESGSGTVEDRPRGTDAILIETNSGHIAWKAQSNVVLPSDDFMNASSGNFDPAIWQFATRAADSIDARHFLVVGK